MNKNKFAITPPMGWNSYDYYDTTVNEEQIKKNAQYKINNPDSYADILQQKNGSDQDRINWNRYRFVHGK